MKRRLSIILIILLTLLAIALVVWVFEKKLRQIDAQPKNTVRIQPVETKWHDTVFCTF